MNGSADDFLECLKDWFTNSYEDQRSHARLCMVVGPQHEPVTPIHRGAW